MASIEDYRAIRELVGPWIGEGLGAAVSSKTVELVQAVEQLNEGKPSDEGASYTQVAECLGVDKSSASRRGRVAINGGYLVNLEYQRGRPARLRIGDPLPDAIEVLPPPELVAERCAVALDPAAEASPPPGGQPGAVLPIGEELTEEEGLQNVLDAFPGTVIISDTTTQQNTNEGE